MRLSAGARTTSRRRSTCATASSASALAAASSWDDMIHRRMLDSRSLEFGGRAVTGYRPMTLAQLASRLADTADDKLRWKLAWEFLEEYRWEPPEADDVLLARAETVEVTASITVSPT